MDCIKGGAIIESPSSNARDAIRDHDGGEIAAIIESPFSNARYAIRDNRALTTSNKRVGCRFNNRIAIFTAVVGGIATIYHYRSEGIATRENLK